jgi:hypothetical protein
MLLISPAKSFTQNSFKLARLCAVYIQDTDMHWLSLLYRVSKQMPASSLSDLWLPHISTLANKTLAALDLPFRDGGKPTLHLRFCVYCIVTRTQDTCSHRTLFYPSGSTVLKSSWPYALKGMLKSGSPPYTVRICQEPRGVWFLVGCKSQHSCTMPLHRSRRQ